MDYRQFDESGHKLKRHRSNGVESVVAQIYRENEELAALSANVADICKKISQPKLRVHQYIAGILLLTIATTCAAEAPTPKPSPLTLWPLLSAVLLARVYIGGRASRLCAIVAALIVLGITVWEIEPDLGWEDTGQIIWGLGWSAVIFGIATLAGSRAKSGYNSFLKRF